MVWSGTLLLLLAGVQIALYTFAAQIALTAAEEGVRAGRYYGVDSPGRAQQTAIRFLDRQGTRLLNETVVTTTTGPGGVMVVKVQGEVLPVLPGAHFTLDRTAVGAVEHPTP